MAERFSLQHASDLSEYTSEIDTEGDFIWNNTASGSPDGSTGCAQCIIDNQTAACGIKNYTVFTTETDMRCGFYVDFGDLALATNDQSFMLWSWRSASAAYIALSIIRVAGVNYFRHSLTDETPTTHDSDVSFASGVPLWVEFWVTKSSTDATADATSRMYFGGGDYTANGSLVSTISGKMFWDAFTLTERIRIGATNVGTGISAAGILLDNIRFRDDTTAIFFVDNAAPTVSDPGTVYTAVGYAEPIGTAVTVADTNSNLSTIRYQCTQANGDITVTLSGGVTVSAGTNGTHDLTITGTHSALLTVHATAVYVALIEGVDAAVIITATDAVAASAARTFSVDAVYLDLYAPTQADLNSTAALVNANDADTGVTIFTITGIDSNSLTDTVQTTVTVSEVAVGGGSGGGGAAISAIQQRKRIIRGRRVRERRFP